ncbi:MAG: sigma 54-interacting transcriptional regulator [Bacillota bacterium]|nr:sigma 54-interacting transcriptional regulator [Bacillota bacterium]
MAMLKFKVLNKDRVGLLLDISKILTTKNINVNSLEIVPDSMYVEVEAEGNIDQKKLFQELTEVKGVTECEKIELLPWEENNQRLQAVLDAISEGVLAINSNAEITAANPIVERIFKSKKEELLGKKISEVLTDQLPMLSCLTTGEPYNHQEIFFKKGIKKFHYVTSGRPIRDKHNQIIGVVATLKDMTEVRQLVYSVTKPEMVTFQDIIGESSQLQTVIQLGQTVAQGGSIVLLRGESGTGKELFARAIHMASSRRDKPFVPVNCAALPDSLLESELFGYTEGAFTGASKKGKVGLFEFANQGTLFLDEVGELSPHLQAKLLRVLQEHKIRPIGSQEEIDIDVRVIAATHKNLEKMVEKNEFRRDLYYRLNVFPIYLPPLRERKEDIILLVNHFLHKMNLRLGKKVEFISKEAIEKLFCHSWYGNVRELENVIERAVNLVSGPWLTPDIVILDQGLEGTERIETGNKTLSQILDKVEERIISQIIKDKGSIRKTAIALGVSHTTIMNKMKKHNISTGK